MVDEVACEVSQLKENEVFSCGSEVTESQREWLEPKHSEQGVLHTIPVLAYILKNRSKENTLRKTEDWLRCLKRR